MSEGLDSVRITPRGVLYPRSRIFFQLKGSFRTQPGQIHKITRNVNFTVCSRGIKLVPKMTEKEINSGQHTHTSEKKCHKTGSKNSFPPGNHYFESQWLIIF